MQFTTFADYLEKLEQTSSRLEMTYQLADLYKALETDEVLKASHLLQGQLVPAYEGVEFQLSVKMIIRALARIKDGAVPTQEATLFNEPDFSQAETEVTQLYKQKGDAGLVAAEILAVKNTKSTLTLIAVYDALLLIAHDHGQGSQERKLVQLIELMEQLDPLGAKYVARIIVGRLRLGFSTMTMIDALSWAQAGDKSESKLLEDAYQKKADIGKLAQVYMNARNSDERAKALAAYTVEVGVPLVPALCQRLNSSAEIIEKMTEVIAEPKFDGLRVQIHVVKGELVRTFTRNLEESSEMFPELIKAVEILNCRSCILDAEAIGYDRETGELKPFQETITRKRKHGISETAEQIPIRCYVFDVLAIDGKSLLSETLQTRKALLKKLFSENDVLKQTPYIVTADATELRNFHEAQLEQGLEGAVIKQIDSIYQSGRKGWSWVKIKEEEGSRGKLNDTLDCIVMGYYAGRGKRTVFGVGAFLVGVLDDDKTIKTIAKIGTGLSDDQFVELKNRCESLTSAEKPSLYDVDKSLVPDVWVSPHIVVEIAADEITKSPNHSAGVALRFPRLVKFRDDKNWEQATTVNETTSISHLK